MNDVSNIKGNRGDEDSMRPSGSKFTITVGDEDLVFRPIEVNDPAPTAKQILEASDFSPSKEYLIFGFSRDHELVRLDLDKTTDIRSDERKLFLIFKGDRSWQGMINGKRFEWGAPEILGRALKWLAGVEPDKHGVWLENDGESVQLIADDERASLSSSGVERFRTDLLFQVWIEGKSFPWQSATITREEIAQIGGLNLSQGIIEVDEEQNERTLDPGEVVELRPGLTFGKKLHFKRGRS